MFSLIMICETLRGCEKLREAVILMQLVCQISYRAVVCDVVYGVDDCL